MACVKLRFLSTAIFGAAALYASSANATLTFDFTFSDDPGVAASTTAQQTTAQQQAIVTSGQFSLRYSVNISHTVRRFRSML